MSEATLAAGKYIVFEGGDNVGKTTQAKILAESIGAVQVREPGSTEAGERIRDLLLDPDIKKATATEVLLHAAQRAELAASVITESLGEGRHVVSDRSWISSAAYQGAQGAELKDITRVNRYALGDLATPDLLIILDADPEEVRVRSTDSSDYYESREAAFHQDVRARFLELGQHLGGVVLGADGSVEEVSALVRETVTNTLGI
jgi:dTMP kinase